MNDDTAAPVAVVTGAASGLGRELARRLAGRGYATVCVDYDEQGLNALAGELRGALRSALCVKVDIAQREEVVALMKQVEARHGRIDLLINNAGIIHPFSKAHKIPLDTAERVMSINFWGTTYMTMEALPLLRQSHARGRSPLLVNVASMGALMPSPGQGYYCASKAAVALLTETLAVELEDEGIAVMLVCPGRMTTNILQNAPYGADDSSRREILASLENGKLGGGLTPTEAAIKLIAALDKRPRKLLIGTDARVLTAMHKLVPNTTNRLLAKAMKMNPALKKALQ